MASSCSEAGGRIVSPDLQLSCQKVSCPNTSTVPFHSTSMETSRRRPLCPLYLAFYLLALNLVLPAQALYFYLDGASTTPKCFYEELPKDTLVVGKHPFSSLLRTHSSSSENIHSHPNIQLIANPGHYTALQYNPQSSTYTTNPDLSITVTVDEVFDSDHRVVNTKGSHTSKFTFSAADAGDHRICFTASGYTSGGWLGSGQGGGQIQMTLDLAIGETSQIESTDKGKMTEIAQKVRDLNSRLQDIRREQVFQRVSVVFSYGRSSLILALQEREAEFRDQSESTNARVVRWTMLQLIVLGVTCAWQLSHLRAFFIKQKLT